MNLPVSDMLRTSGKWFAGDGPWSDGILSTRVRLARNLKGMRFPGRALAEELSNVLHRVESASLGVTALEGRQLLQIEGLSVLERQFLLERHLISYDLASSGDQCGLVFAADENVGVMINEEDHIRIQALRPGFQLDECYQAASDVDDQLGSSLEYAFSDDFGYLTACPTNVGTGLRASVLVHLPALVLTRKIKKVLTGVNQVGLAVRGFYGEGTDVLGNFFQISNQITLGEKESQALLNLERVVRQLLDYEEKARDVLMKDAREQIEDKVMRALGVFTHAHLLTSEEVIGLSSAIRLGITLSMEGLPRTGIINEILLYAQPGHMQMMAGTEMSSEERNIRRSEFIRGRLKDDLAA
ncbi:MAG: protein arginine kinase [Candidatus Eisenbacteria sp.]|nr:protein arginine kinase [Candidatus Eisenbacteria bacterium]